YTVTLQGELGTMLGWIDRSGKPGYKPKAETASSRMSVSVIGGACPGHPRLGPSRQCVDGRDKHGHPRIVLT
ncbi:hypothetical protein, partial [Serratia marcescens]|uniref:hypothetical protein n=1 Tax=Serratia marcescens TaxID=615 RepID=UPI001952E67C